MCQNCKICLDIILFTIFYIYKTWQPTSLSSGSYLFSDPKTMYLIVIGPNDTVLKTLDNRLVGIGFASPYWLQPSVFKGPIGKCKATTPFSLFY